MEIKIDNELKEGFVVLSLAEYERLKKIEEESHELWEQKIRDILDENWDTLNQFDYDEDEEETENVD